MGTVAITVAGVNDAPQATTDAFATSEDAPLTVALPGLLANDGDVDGDAITANGFSGVSSRGASLIVNSDGSFSYDPRGVAVIESLAVGQTLNDTFSYTITDGKGGTSTATVTVAVSGANDAPVAQDDNYRTDEDSVLVVSGEGVLANDTDTDAADLLTVATYDLTSAKGAPVAANDDGTFSYDPTKAPEIQSLRPGQTMEDTFTYRAADGTAQSNVATVTVTIDGRNDPPKVVNDVYDIEEDGRLDVDMPGVLSNDSDPEGSTLTAMLATGATHGQLALSSSGSFTYVPNTNFFGTDSFTYRARDGAANSVAATVTINVTPVNDTPIGMPDVYDVDQDTALIVAAADGVLQNDIDEDEEALRAIHVSGSGPRHGTLTLNEDGSFTYEPNAGFIGDDSFQYEAQDASGESTGPVTVTINVVNTRLWRNADNPLDVNDDGSVSPQDVLIVVNYLNTNGSGPVPVPTPPGPPFRDVNGDNSVTPADGLEIINYINTLQFGEGEAVSQTMGEGELDAPSRSVTSQYVLREADLRPRNATPPESAAPRVLATDRLFARDADAFLGRVTDARASHPSQLPAPVAMEVDDLIESLLADETVQSDAEEIDAVLARLYGR
jgi:VCBS repeat-containing protein